MNKKFKITITVVFIFIGAAFFTVKTSAGFTGENSENLSTNNSFTQKKVPVRTLYLNNCARCHGADGRAETELGKLYDATNLTDRKAKRSSRKRVANVIKNGAGSMPGFNKKLTTAEINSLVGYIKTL